MFRITLAILTCLTLAGCGALFKGTTQSVNINSSPPNSIIEVDGGIYTTPATIELARKNDYIVTISKDGYESRTVKISKQVSGGIVILDILGGLYPLLIDAIMGTWYNLSPSSVNVNLESKRSGAVDIPVNISAIGEGIRIESDAPVTIRIKKTE